MALHFDDTFDFRISFCYDEAVSQKHAAHKRYAHAIVLGNAGPFASIGGPFN